MENQTVKKTSSQVMELQQLIAGPLIATIEADALSAQKFISSSVCLQPVLCAYSIPCCLNKKCPIFQINITQTFII